MKKIKIFDKNYFLFSLALISKKISIYISISIYLILILSYTLFVPLIAEKPPIELFLFPIAPSFLMFAMVVVSCFIAIEIFRTPIDDGTELLVVSKPLSRREICVVKFSIFYIYIIAISCLGSIIATTAYAIPNSNYVDNTHIVVGTLIGSFIIGLLFGSVAILFSLYSKKIISMLLTIGIAFILNISSMLGTVIYETPTQIISNSQNIIAATNLLNINNNKSNIVSGMIKGSVTNNKSVSEIYNEAFSKNIYTKTIYFDFSLQLSSLYTFGKPAQDIALNIAAQSYTNTPFKLEFKNYDLPTLSNYQNTSSSYTLIELPDMLSENYSKDKYMLLFSTSSSTYIDSNSGLKYNIYESYKYENNELSRQTTSNQEQFDSFFIEDINYALEKYLNSSDSKPVLPSNFNELTKREQILTILLILSKGINKITSNALENEFKQSLINKYSNPKDYKNFEKHLKEFNQIIYTGIDKLLNKKIVKIDFPIFNTGNNNLTDSINTFVKEFFSSNRDLINQLILLRLLSMDFEQIINDISSSTFSENSFRSNVPFSSQINNETVKFIYKPSYKVVSQTAFLSFEQIEVSPLLNTIALIVSWLVISWVFLSVTMSLYFRRDFA